jgi:CRP-like cAMP-binding protein
MRFDMTHKHAETRTTAAEPAHAVNALRGRRLPDHDAQAALCELPIRIAGLFGHNPFQNHILAALPQDEFERLSPLLELVSMPAGTVLAAADMPGQHAYFPTSCVVSLLHDTREGACAETAVIGNEGLIGITQCLGGSEMPGRAMVKCAGHGFRMRSADLRTEFERGGALQAYLLRFVQALLTQFAQSAVCHRHHSVSQQFCRWLLLCIDRLPSPELNMTQELIARMLGVRRESIAEAAAKLQDENLIRYSRGRIIVSNRAGLEERACECYEAVTREYRSLLPTVLGARAK